MRVFIALLIALVLPVLVYLGCQALGLNIGLFWIFLGCLVVCGVYVKRSEPRKS
jgi:hypothetical protein